MNNEGKIVDELEKFIISVIKRMKPNTKASIRIGSKRTMALGTERTLLTVLNKEEAIMLKDNLEQQGIIVEENNKDKFFNEQEVIEEDPLEAWKEIFESKKKEEHDALLEEYMKKFELVKQEPTRKPKKNKRNLRRIFKKLKDESYKLSKETKEKAVKAKKYLEENGKKVGSLIVVATLLAGVATHEIYSDVKGYQTYKEYGSTEKIELSANEIIANEFRKALDNDNLEIETDDITSEDDLGKTYKITITEHNNPDFEMTLDVGAFDWNNPLYMAKIVQEYEKIKNVNKIKNNKLTEVISAAKAGRALNYVEKKAKENDIIIKEGPITRKLNMDRVSERTVDDTEDIER